MTTEAPARSVVDDLTQTALFAADGAAMDARQEGATYAEVTRRSVARAIECLIGNGMIVVTDPESWPEWRKVDPPYDTTIREDA